MCIGLSRFLGCVLGILGKNRFKNKFLIEKTKFLIFQQTLDLVIEFCRKQMTPRLLSFFFT
jgi:hypothetical protein